MVDGVKSIAPPTNPDVARDSAAIAIAFIAYNVANVALAYPVVMRTAAHTNTYVWSWGLIIVLDAFSIGLGFFLADRVRARNAQARKRYWIVVAIAFIANIGIFGLILAAPLLWFVHRRLDSPSMRAAFGEAQPLPWFS
jgi:general stress protein CsbA